MYIVCVQQISILYTEKKKGQAGCEGAKNAYFIFTVEQSLC